MVENELRNEITFKQFEIDLQSISLADTSFVALQPVITVEEPEHGASFI
jgi:hypothetical protein